MLTKRHKIMAWPIFRFLPLRVPFRCCLTVFVTAIIVVPMYFTYLWLAKCVFICIPNGLTQFLFAFFLSPLSLFIFLLCVLNHQFSKLNHRHRHQQLKKQHRRPLNHHHFYIPLNAYSSMWTTCCCSLRTAWMWVSFMPYQHFSIGWVCKFCFVFFWLDIRDTRTVLVHLHLTHTHIWFIPRKWLMWCDCGMFAK